MSAFQKFLMLTSFVYLASPTATEIKEKKWMKIQVEKDSWIRNEITSLESHGSING